MKKRTRNEHEPGHVTPAGRSVFYDLGFDEAEARVLEMRADLMAAQREHIEKRGWTQSEAAKKLGITQPRISALMKGAWRDCQSSVTAIGSVASSFASSRLARRVETKSINILGGRMRRAWYNPRKRRVRYRVASGPRCDSAVSCTLQTHFVDEIINLPALSRISQIATQTARLFSRRPLSARCCPRPLFTSIAETQISRRAKPMLTFGQ
jgi:predicted XRE-type DNA-binding protein